MDTIEKIKEIIVEYDLRNKTRIPSMVYRRQYLFYKLKQLGLRLRDIAEIFDMNHCSILYGMNRHMMWSKSKDQMYLNVIAPIMRELGDEQPYEETLHIDVKKTGIIKKITITGIIDPVVLDNLKEYMTMGELCANLFSNVEKS
jgi:hypothetical protein